MDQEYFPILARQARDHLAAGRLDEAESVCACLQHDYPEKSETWLLMGNLQSRSGAFDKAIECARTALELNPRCVESRLMAGQAQLAMGRFAAAFAEFKAAADVDPYDVDAHLGLGITYQSDNYFREALSCYQRALAIQPNLYAAHYNSGLVHDLLGEFDAALDCFRRAQAISPSVPAPLIARAWTHEKKGELDAAARLLMPLIERGVRDAQAGMVFARLCQHLNRQGDAIEYIETLLHHHHQQLSRADLMQLHFALAQLHEKLGHYDPAFEHYREANLAHGHSYDPQADKAVFDAFIAGSDSDTIRNAPLPSVRSGRPVFIVGMPRSGTSLVEAILASHPDVAGGGERRDIIDMAEALSDRLNAQAEYPACLRQLTSQGVDELVGEYLARLDAISSSAVLVTSKMPHNFMHLPLIRILFPDALIIHCQRNPLDTCLSCYFQLFAGQALPYSYDLFNMGRHYSHYLRLMEHWKSSLGISMFGIRYEELVADQERVTRELLDYCGLEWHDDCLDFHRSQHVTRTASYGQVRQPLYSVSVDRWKHYQRYLEPLQAGLDQSGI